MAVEFEGGHMAVVSFKLDRSIAVNAVMDLRDQERDHEKADDSICAPHGKAGASLAERDTARLVNGL